MDPIAAFKNEVFRPIASIVLPGLFAIAPFVILLCNLSPSVNAFANKQATATFLMVVGAATIIGMLLENLGSSIERGIDECMEREYLVGSVTVWDEYLSAVSMDSNAKRYLGTLVTRLKFINSLIPATAIFSIGLISLHFQLKRWDWWVVLSAVIFAAAVILWLFRVSTELSEAASNSRHRILVGQGSAVPGYNPDARTVGRQRHLAYVLAEIFTSRVNELDLRGKNGMWVVLWILERSWFLPMALAFVVGAIWAGV